MQNFYQKKLLIVSGLFVVMSVGIFLFLYLTIKKNDAIAKEAGKNWQLAVEKREKLSSLDSLVRNIEGEKVALETHFAHSSDIVPFLDTMDSIGTQAKVNSSVSSVDVLADKSGLVAHIKASGSFEAIYSFLVLLENSPYELEFSSVNLHREDAGDPTAALANAHPTWNIDFQVKLISFVP